MNTYREAQVATACIYDQHKDGGEKGERWRRTLEHFGIKFNENELRNK